ncbi:MAG: 4-alpha-glucanotransferase, partial [Lachnospiraceae bacterium]|nr:4-alpha-glucanotransferase [Lachnospiraceae bacterium]
KKFSKEHRKEILFYMFLQYLFFKQWRRLKKYANKKGIRLIGDIPIYVALDSADVWAAPELFQLDEDSFPKAVAGCPPDGFSATGQLWGNPLYDWEVHKKENFAWWIRRVKHCQKLYDVIRIDHFRGFDEYYSIPAGDDTAVNGHWEKGPGFALFARLKEALGNARIIAEDLGYLNDSVRQLVKITGYPGMKVLEFAFDSRDDSSSDYLPFRYDKNCVVYTGTHDNETVLGWLSSIRPEEKQAIYRYLGLEHQVPDAVLAKKLVRLAMSSTADLCIIPMQDYLGLGNEARINEPSTLGTNWSWRMKRLTEGREKALAGEILELTKVYGRMGHASDR